MTRTREQLCSRDSFEPQTKKLRTTYNEQSRSITCIEELPNELSYQIFEYLDGCDIYKAFSKLNTLFQHLINNSPIPLKIQVAFESESELKYYCKNVILPSRNRIVSLDLFKDFFIDEFFRYCIIDASFASLKCINLFEISSAKLLALLSYFKSLPRLFSLSAHVNKRGPFYFSDTYRIILSLPVLKYNQLAWETSEELNISIPFAINESVSTIKYLTINHECTLNELISILYHTPRLHYLCCDRLIESHDDVINIEKPIVLPNLTNVHFNFCLLEFDELETFIKRYSTNVQVFSTTHCLYTDYLDADRWERLINTYMPYLHKFNFEYYGDLLNFSENNFLNESLNRFTSPFWTEHQWIFEYMIENDHINCLIHSVRDTLIDIYKHTEISTFFNQYTDYNNTQDVVISRLNINCTGVSTELLTRIICSLPNLDSLKVSSLRLTESDFLLENGDPKRYLAILNNKITKVNLKNMVTVEEVKFFFLLCKRMQYFQVNIPNGTDLNRLVRFILNESKISNPDFTSLSLNISNANQEMIDRLQNIIMSENLLSSYIIKRVGDNIILKWN